jgi:ATP-binding cassette subfamily F protein uup
LWIMAQLPPLLQLSGIALTFGGTPLLEGAELSVSTGERVCLVGRNGSGKSTLLRIAAGLIEADRGERFVQPGAVIRYLPQEPDLTDHATTLSYVEAGLSPTDDPHQARYLLQQLGLDGSEDPARLSGGETRRAALVRVLAPSPDILLLDEPTNHLDLPAIEWLENWLTQRRGALVLISHDRRFLETLCRTTVWLDRGVTRRVNLGFDKFENWRDEHLAQEETVQHKLDRRIVREEHWVRYGVTARRKRNLRRMAALQSLRQDRRDHRKAAGKAVIEANEAEVSGALVIEAKDIGKALANQAIVEQYSTRIKRGDRVGIVGPNGSGKSTLVKLLTGALAPDRGTVRLGGNLQMATLDQNRESLDPNWTVIEALCGEYGDTISVGGSSRHVISYMRDFLFTPEQGRTPLRALSGGERGRLMLARALAKPSNLLVLDEPTNDLDLETLDVLEEMLGNYAGTVLLISHDRDFLDRVVNTVVVPDGAGRWVDYAGGYTDMLAQRGADLAGKQALEAKPASGAAVSKNARDDKGGLRRKLSFYEKRALESLPIDIATLQARIRELQRRLEDPDFYIRDRAAFTQTSVALASAQSELSAKEQKWLELEIRREEIEGS